MNKPISQLTINNQPIDYSYSKDAEISVISSIILDNSCFDEVYSRIDTLDFVLPEHQKIFTAIKTMLLQGNPVDIITLADFMGSNEWIYPIAKICQSITTAANAIAYADIVNGQSAVRKLIALSETINKNLHSKPISETITTARQALNKVEISLQWKALLKTDKHGKIINCPSNLYHILLNDSEFRGVIAYNQFTRKVMKLKHPPFNKGITGEWLDEDDTKTGLWMYEKYGFKTPDEIIQKFIRIVSEFNEFHPVKNYLDSLSNKWDGINRVYTWLADSVGCNNTEYTQNVGKCFLIGAIARILQKGCKVDTVLILEGKQGIGKSRLLRELCQQAEWFSDTPFEIGSKDAFISLRGKWIVELAELDTLSRAEANAAKAFFSSQVDSYREPYGRQTIEIPRENIFAGTVNNQSYLRDTTGNRRYLPIECSEIDLDYITQNRDQLWAEALVMYRRAEKWWIDAKDSVHAEVERQQKQRVDTDMWQPTIEEYVSVKAYVTAQEILTNCLKIPIDRQDQRLKTRIANVMQLLGWCQIQKKVNGKKNRIYVKNQHG